MTGKTVWDDRDFVDQWNETYGLDMARAVVRAGLVYPLVESVLGDMRRMHVVDLGCGNGNLMLRFEKHAYRSFTGIDGGSEVIKTARASVTDIRTRFRHADITDRLPLGDESTHAITNIFVLEEIPAPRLSPLFSEAARILKKGGDMLVFTNHPVNALYYDLEACRKGTGNLKYEGLKGYYDTDPSTYTLSIMNQRDGFPVKVDHHHKPLPLIMNAFSQAGLACVRFEEIPAGVGDMDGWAAHRPKTGDRPQFLFLHLKKL